jgi:hypothetical protein
MRRDAIADITERLMSDHADTVPLGTVSAVVLEAWRELSGQVPTATMPEMLYRLCEQRLQTIGPRQTTPPTGRPER